MPKDVRDAFGRSVVTWSTQELDRPRAEEKALPFISALRSEWNELRLIALGSSPEGTGDTPTDSQLIAIADEAFKMSRASHMKREKSAFATDPGGYEDRLRRSEREQLSNIRAIEFQDFDQWVEPAARMLGRRGFKVDRTSDWFRRFVEMIADVTVSSIDVFLRGARGEFDASSTSRTVLKARQLEEEALVGGGDVSFSELAEAFMRQWKAGSNDRKTTNTEQQKRATYRLFGGFWGNKTIRLVGPHNAAEFRDALKLFDPNWARSPKAVAMSWRTLSSTFGDRPRGLSDGTMNRHMAALKELWAWARKRGHCEGDNPFDGFHKKLRPGSNVDPYVAWDLSELKHLFEPPPRRSDVTEIMIVAMFTGMRLDEVASLTWDRVKTDHQADTSISYFQIKDAKTSAGNRQVPVHSAIQWLVDRRLEGSVARVWPNFNAEGVGKKAGADAGREFSTFKISRGFTTRPKSFHSFRKNVTRIMERAGIPENDWAQVFGHERGFTYSVYNPDGITLSRKADIIKVIEYPGLDIPHPS